MLRWFLAKLSIIKKVFNFGDDSDNSDDNDNKNGALPPAAIKKTPTIGGEIPPTAGVHII